MTVGLALSVVVGVAIVALGHKFGSAGMQQLLVRGGVVAIASEGGVIGARYLLCKALQPKPATEIVERVSSESASYEPNALDRLQADMIRRNGGSGQTQVCVNDIGISAMQSFLSEGDEAVAQVYAQDTARIAEAVGEDGIEANQEIQQLGQQQRLLLKELSSLVRSPEDWKREEVQKKFGEFLDVANKLSEAVENFVKRKFPDDLEKQGRFLGSHEVPGYVNAFQGVAKFYGMAATSSYFSMDVANEKVNRFPGTRVEEYWNDPDCWVKGDEDEQFFTDGTVQSGWRLRHNAWCDRNIPLGQNICNQSGTFDSRTLELMTRHEERGKWSEPSRGLAQSVE